MSTGPATPLPSVPDPRGHFGAYGGVYVPETLVSALEELETEYKKAQADPTFRRDFEHYLREFVGRPSRFYYAKRLTEKLGGAKIYLKREDLNHTGAHKINNTIGQALLTVRMGKKRVIAETGAGQHGVATATVAALFDLQCDVYMGAEDVRRQNLNVFRMKLMGANVIEVQSGSKTLKDAAEREAARLDGIGREDALHHRLGRRAAPVPADGATSSRASVRSRASSASRPRTTSGRRDRLRRRRLERGRHLPPVLRRQGGAPHRRRGGRAARPRSASTRPRSRSASRACCTGRCRTCCRTTTARPPTSTPSRPASTTPASARSTRTGRTRAASTTSASPTPRRLDAFKMLARLEGILPALEPAPAIADAVKRAPTLGKDKLVLINLSGRGDKDCQQVARLLGS